MQPDQGTDAADAYLRSAKQLFERGEFQLAAEQLNALIAAVPHHAMAYFELTRCLRILNRHDEALTILQRGLSYAPNHPDGRNWLATILVDLGRFDEAKTVYRDLIRRWPNYGTAYCGLASVQRLGVDDPEVAAMEHMLEQTPIADQERSNLHFALGRVYDQSADYDRAFEHYRRGNTLRRGLHDYDLAAERES